MSARKAGAALMPGLRLTAFVLSVALHGAGVYALVAHPRPEEAEALPDDVIEVSIAPPEGETLDESTQTEDSRAQQATVAAAQKQAPPPPQQLEQVAPPKVIAPDAETMAAAPKPPPPDPTPPPPDPPPTPQPEPPKPTKSTANAQAQPASEESFAKQKIGVSNGSEHGGMTRAAYAAKVRKEIARHRRRPERPGHGSVRIFFVIGPDGKPARIEVVHHVTPWLDATAREIVAAVRLPPPPGGSFSATIAIDFK